jgi:PASTA domain/FG-GAP-like repeat
VTANGAPSTLSVLLNRGDASFLAKHDYKTGVGPRSVAIGDLNGDNTPDLASGNSTGTVSVLTNRGDGSFGARRDFRASFAGSYSIAIRDLSGDGRPELTTANMDPNTVSVLLNRGNATFGAKREYPAGLEPHGLAIGELNSDARSDLAVADFRGNGVSVLLNATGLCGVPNVRAKTLPAAKRTLARARCRLGMIRRAYSKFVKKGRVISQKPKAGTVLPNGGEVAVLVSRGRKH